MSIPSKHKFGIPVDRNVTEQLLERKYRERLGWDDGILKQYMMNRYYRGAVGALLVYGNIPL